MIKQFYTRSRFTENVGGTFETVKKEMIEQFEAIKKLIDDAFDAEEQYVYDGEGFKTLEADCQPIRVIECTKLIIKNDIVVGSVILRGTNNRPKHDIDFLQDTLEREYELRFKTYAGCDFSVESAGIAVSQFGRGPLLINTGNIAGFNVAILERHWNEFKAEVAFSATDLLKPTKLQKWSSRYEILSGISTTA